MALSYDDLKEKWHKSRVSDEKSVPKTFMQRFREWAYHIISSMFIVAFIKWATLDIFIIPTPSMEGSLLAGDFLFVSKLTYGPRTPQTLLQIPLTNGTVWGTNIPAYLDWIKLPMYRLWGFSEVSRGDAVVFNYPGEAHKPPDVRTFYVKRCIGMPGDTLRVWGHKRFINGDLVEEKSSIQHLYLVDSKQVLNDRVFDSYGIRYAQPSLHGYEIHAGKSSVEALGGQSFIRSITPILSDSVPGMQGFPLLPDNASRRRAYQSQTKGVNPDYYGPLWVPKAGLSLAVNDSTLVIYGQTILIHEGLKNAKVQANELFIDNEKVASYTFKKDYYFMMGDNRHNSEDSRYWGFVPEDHIVGKPLLVLMSFDPTASIFKKFRWSRVCKIPE